MSHVDAIRQAKWAFDHKGTATKEDTVNRVVELAEWRLFSNSQITTFTGMLPRDVGIYTGKTDRTGGRLEGEALGLILDVIAIKAQNEVDDSAIKKALEGTSSVMLARLTGIPKTTINRWARRAA